jgi:CheY-like chemotaxis protein
MLAALLEMHGMKVSVARSAAEALSQLKALRPDVLISDIGMPGVDGYAFIRRVRTLSSRQKDTPAIALTAFATQQDRERALTEGFNIHVAKPVEPSMLVKAVQDLAGPVTLGTRSR